jgi:hypothetical protein
MLQHIAQMLSQHVQGCIQMCGAFHCMRRHHATKHPVGSPALLLEGRTFQGVIDCADAATPAPAGLLLAAASERGCDHWLQQQLW